MKHQQPVMKCLLQDQWIEKFQEAIENYESIQLKDMLKCTPLMNNRKNFGEARQNGETQARTGNIGGAESA